MKKLFIGLAVAVILACNPAPKGRFNYPYIKSLLSLNADQESKFDDITSDYLGQGYELYNNHNGSEAELHQKLGELGAKQDGEIKTFLTAEQFEIYAREMKIEREGREQYNVQLIKNELNLDSAQTVTFNQVNAVFYKTLIDNHDNYHGKPDVYQEYYKELDKSRKAAMKKLLSEEKFKQYEKLVEQYNIGKSEH